MIARCPHSEEGVFTVRIVAASAAGCDDSVADFENDAVPGGGFRVTAAASGSSRRGPRRPST